MLPRWSKVLQKLDVLNALTSDWQRPYNVDVMLFAHFITFSLLSCPPNVLWQSWLEKSYPGYTSAKAFGTADSIAEHPAVKSLNEKTSTTTTAIEENGTIKGVTRRATDGMDKVKSKAAEINARTSDMVRTSGIIKGSPPRAMTFSTADGQAVKKPAESGSNKASQDNDQKKAGSQKKLNIRNTAIKFGLDQTIGALANTVLFIAGMAALRGEGLEQIWAEVQRVSRQDDER